MTAHPAMAAEQVVLGAVALSASRETGVLERLQDGAATPRGLSAELDLDERLLARTLDALAALGVVTAGDEGQCWVHPGVEAGLAVADRYAVLADAMRGRATPLSVDQSGGAAEVYPGLVGVLGTAFAGAAAEVAELVARPGVRVLDVGAGAAPWSLAILHREPSASAVALDLPEVVGVTQDAVARAGIARRVEVVGGDVFDGALDGELGGPFDVVLVAHLCHLFDRGRAEHLLAEVAGQVADGGCLVVIDVLPDGAENHPGLALYALGLALRTSSGGLHGRGDYEQWLGSAGLGSVVLNRTAEGMAVLVARRPGPQACDSAVPDARTGRSVLRHGDDEGTDVATAATERLTYEQWAARPETNRIEELIDGELVVTPLARAIHQSAVTELLVRFHAHARERGDRVVPAPFGIRAGERTVVEPDLVYFLVDRVDFDDRQHTVTTPPDLVVEVLSPSNRAHDLVRKRRIFEQHRIREAWFVDTDARRIEQVVLGHDGGYGTPVVHEPGQSVTSVAVPELQVAVADVLRDAWQPAGG